MSDTSINTIPASIEAERAVIGCLLIDKDAILDCADILKTDDFYLSHHQIIYKVALDLFHKSVPIDLSSIAGALESSDTLSTVGGMEYLKELYMETPMASRIRYYATFVKKTSLLRQLIKTGQKIAALGFDTEIAVEDLLEKAEKELFNLTQDYIKDRFIHVKEILMGRYERIQEIHSDPSKATQGRISSGFIDLDKVLSGGFAPSDLVIIAARPSIGKTALALEFAQKAALHTDKNKRKKVAIISLEMGKEQLVDRILCAQLGIDNWHLQHGKTSPQVMEKMGDVVSKIANSEIYIDDSMGGSLTELRTKIRRLQMERGIDMVLIDYLQLMSSDNPNNRVQEISEISRSLKLIARELHIPVIALSQLSRNVEMRPDKRPVLSDLRDSGAIEQDADVVMMLYRDSYYEENSDDMTLEVNVLKHRNGGTGKVNIYYDRRIQKFTDVVKG